MSRRTGTEAPVPTVHLRIATRKDLTTLARLSQLYRHDLNQFSGQDIGPDAAFDDSDLVQYLDNAQYRAHLFCVDEQLAGFGLVNLNSHSIEDESVRNLDDFFILRKWRRQGVGFESARLLLSDHPGLWQVNKRTYNRAAMAFWDRVIHSVSVGDVREHIAMGDIHMHIFRVAPGQPG